VFAGVTITDNGEVANALEKVIILVVLHTNLPKFIFKPLGKKEYPFALDAIVDVLKLSVPSIVAVP
jgi:hypothetical protein